MSNETSPLPLPLTAYLQHFAQAKVLCIGDVMIDRFIEGSVKRISPESPVPVFNAGKHELFAGGAANVARNIAALGARCTLIGVVGDDGAAVELADRLVAGGGITAAFAKAADRPTTEKTRYVTQGHHMLRVDVEVAKPVSAQVESELIAKVAAHINEAEVLVLSDYAKGVLTERVVREAIALARQAGKPVIVDPKSSDFSRYAGATVITPNAKEVAAATGIEPADNAEAVAAGRAALANTEVEAILITRSEKGMSLVPAVGESTHIPTIGREVFDVVGAGDTVIGTLAIALAAGASLEQSARIANTAAGIVVGKRGTATVSPDELMLELETQARGSVNRGAPVMLSPEEAARYARARRAEGKRVGFTNGVFDILHPGHISLLHFSREACDCLIVGLNSDASVKRLKGPTRPINSEGDRAIVLGALGTVDAVVIFDTDTPIDLISAIRPDVLVKGADYTIATVVGARVVQSYGGQVLLANLIPGVSSTNTITKARLGEAR
jgi:D-beta-D-heptose 7-phosphate kinase/D-beta-D-heptose 1-phosphate adenosyltransferase